MATQAYLNWVAEGRPFVLARPVIQYRDAFRAAGWPVLSIGTIGDQAHLQADRPQDHTPFSVTGWPGGHPYPYVLAIDVLHGVSRETELDSVVSYWVSEARLGRTPWVKYIIYKGRSWDVRNQWGERSADGHYDHVHVSMRTDYVSTSIGTWKPLGTGGPMTTPDPADPARNTGWWLQSFLQQSDPLVVPTTDQAGAPPLYTLPNLVQRQLDRIETKAGNASAVVDPLALAQALVAQPGFVDSLATAFAARVGMIPTAREIAGAISELRFQVRGE